MTFYQTIPVTEEQLQKYRQDCNNQNERILLVFKIYKRPMTPFEVSRAYAKIFVQGGIITPITSIRRALTTLTKEGKLEKTTELREGDYGKINHVWRIPVPREPKTPGVQTKLF